VVLITDQEYGAVDRMWQAVCSGSGATLSRVPLPIPAPSPDALAEAIGARLAPSVRVVSFSHLSSEAAQQFPVGRVLEMVAAAGAISVIDGAHAPGQVAIDLSATGADFYVGNCHKWMLAPKGAAFVYAGERWLDRIRPPVVSWGTISEGTSALLLETEWQGTSDISAILAVADAIEFQRTRHWMEKVVPACARLLDEVTPKLLAVTGQESLYGSPALRPPQMASFRLPDGDHASLHSDLYHRYRVEVPVLRTRHGWFIRVSVQAYNDGSDLQRLVDALAELL
jgi:isopenicillin-N epimerase